MQPLEFRPIDWMGFSCGALSGPALKFELIDVEDFVTARRVADLITACSIVAGVAVMLAEQSQDGLPVSGLDDLPGLLRDGGGHNELRMDFGYQANKLAVRSIRQEPNKLSVLFDFTSGDTPNPALAATVLACATLILAGPRTRDKIRGKIRKASQDSAAFVDDIVGARRRRLGRRDAETEMPVGGDLSRDSGCLDAVETLLVSTHRRTIDFLQTQRVVSNSGAGDLSEPLWVLAQHDLDVSLVV